MGNYKLFDKFTDLIDTSKMSNRSKRFFKLSGFILLIVFMKFDYIQDNIFNFNLIGNRLQQQRAVQRELNHLVEKYKKDGCVYVAINLFHNGATALNGTHFTKMSREYEGRKEGKPILTYKMKGYDIGPFTDEFVDLDKDLRLYIPNVDKYEKQYLKTFLQYYEYKSVLYIAIHEESWWRGRRFVGYMTFEFDKPTNFTGVQLEAMQKEYNLRLKDLVKG